MTDNDWKILAEYGVTPDNLTVRGGLHLVGTAITHLPDGLTVGGNLELYKTAITHLPDGLTVGGYLYLRGTKITGLYECERGYKLARVGDVYHCGCRRFTAAAAVAHWTDPQYPNLKRGLAFADAVRAEEVRRKEETE